MLQLIKGGSSIEAREIERFENLVYGSGGVLPIKSVARFLSQTGNLDRRTEGVWDYLLHKANYDRPGRTLFVTNSKAEVQEIDSYARLLEIEGTVMTNVAIKQNSGIKYIYFQDAESAHFSLSVTQEMLRSLLKGASNSPRIRNMKEALEDPVIDLKIIPEVISNTDCIILSPVYYPAYEIVGSLTSLPVVGLDQLGRCGKSPLVVYSGVDEHVLRNYLSENTLRSGRTVKLDYDPVIAPYMLSYTLNSYISRMQR